MNTPLSSGKDMRLVASEALSLGHLLEAGLRCMQQGQDAEGITLFARARERLSPDQGPIAASLDALIQSSNGYWHARQVLLEASRRFAESERAHHEQLLTLEKLLPTLLMSTTRGSLDSLPQDAFTQEPFQASQLPCPDLSIEQPSILLGPPDHDADSLPALYVTCFGRFEVKRLNQVIPLCSNRSGQLILRFLIAQPEHCATIDTLMTTLWPEDEPEVAQPKLHIAISALRRSLNASYSSKPGGGYILCKNRVYHLNPQTVVQADVEEFLQYYREGQLVRERKVALYEKACNLYTGPFLSEDLYADWSFLKREQLSQTYLAMCRELADHHLRVQHYEDTAKWASAILKENRCDEAAHRYLMQVYAAQRRRSEALQQYQRCARILREELGVSPLPETTHLFQMLLTNQFSPAYEAKT